MINHESSTNNTKSCSIKFANCMFCTLISAANQNDLPVYLFVNVIINFSVKSVNFFQIMCSLYNVILSSNDKA